jgi:hypothetical protein
MLFHPKSKITLFIIYLNQIFYHLKMVNAWHRKKILPIIKSGFNCLQQMFFMIPNQKRICSFILIDEIH